MPKHKHTRAVREVIIPIGPSIAYVPLTQGQFALIDRDDAVVVSRRNWFAHLDRKRRAFYAATNEPKPGSRQRMLGLHRYLLGDVEGLMVDHANGSSLDNRRSNLRLATSSNNQHNRAARRDSSTQLKGVIRQSGDQVTFKAGITVARKRVHLGTFTSAKDAHAAYCEAAASLHGEFARTA